MDIAPIPDTAAARAAAIYLRGISTRPMIHHCRRSFQFGMALGAKIGARPDVEVLYIGALFHDLGLEPDHESDAGDFDVVSAREAEAFLRRGGYAEELVMGVRTAIELVALAFGWVLGGTVGIGTVLFALTVGPNAQFWLGRLDLGHPPGFDPVLDPEVDPDATLAAN